MIKEAVYKITENCPCNCSFCDSREKYEKILKKKTMTLDQWINITNKLLDNGLEVVVISGGEPLLHEEIALPLTKYLQDNGVFVVINASGALFSENNKKLNNLLKNYPDLLVFSVDSSNSEKHDINRSFDGLFERVINSIKYIKSIGDYPVGIRTVITKNNYTEIPEIIRKFSSLGVDCIKLTNIENDLDGNFRLSKEDLDFFNSEIKPKIYEVLKDCYYEDDFLLDESLEFNNFGPYKILGSKQHCSIRYLTILKLPFNKAQLSGVCSLSLILFKLYPRFSARYFIQSR